jgi:hypothetical protein
MVKNYFKNQVEFINGANIQMAKTIIFRTAKDFGYREKEILENLASVERNNNVPEGYIQYIFYNNEGEGFQAGKYANGSYGISL